MRYVIVDLDGSPRGHYPSPADAVEALDEVRGDDPELLDELFVVAYGDDGNRTGRPLPANNLIPRPASDSGFALETYPAGALTFAGGVPTAA